MSGRVGRAHLTSSLTGADPGLEDVGTIAPATPDCQTAGPGGERVSRVLSDTARMTSQACARTGRGLSGGASA